MKLDTYEEFKVKCKKCNDTGWIYKENQVYKCPCRLSQITENISNRMKIPKKYRHATLENFKPYKEYGHDEILKRIKRYILSNEYKEGKGLIFIGPPGIGKTHLAVSILKEFFLKRNIVGLFRDTRTLLFDLKSTFDGSGSSRELLQEVLSAPILVLDDLGSERLSDWARDILHYILIHRYNELKPIIITTNLEIDIDTQENESLETRMGKPIVSRISEICEPIYMTGEDHRTMKKLNKISKEEDSENS